MDAGSIPTPASILQFLKPTTSVVGVLLREIHALPDSALSHLQRLNQRPQRRGNLPSAGIVEIKTGKRRAPIVQHPQQPSVGEIRRGVTVSGVGEADAVGGGAVHP